VQLSAKFITRGAEMNKVSTEEGLVLLKYIELTNPLGMHISDSERIRILTEYNLSIGQTYVDYGALTVQEMTMLKYQISHLLRDFDYTPSLPDGMTPVAIQHANTQVAHPNQANELQDTPTPTSNKVRASIGVLLLLAVCGGVFSVTAFVGKGGVSTTKDVTPIASQEVDKPIPKPTPTASPTPKPKIESKSAKTKPNRTQNNGNVEPEEAPSRPTKPRRNDPLPVQDYERDSGMNNPDYQPPAPRAENPPAYQPPVAVKPQPKPPSPKPSQPKPSEPPVKPPVVIDSPPPEPPPTLTPEPQPPAPPKLPDVVVPTLPPIEEAPRASNPPTIPDSLNQPGNVVIIKGGKP
jgi:hypothetical protein